jgi:hypothetical protein
MNILTFNSRELDVIYDALIMHMLCTDNDGDACACNSINDKMHIHTHMNQDEVWSVRYKELRMNHK